MPRQKQTSLGLAGLALIASLLAGCQPQQSDETPAPEPVAEQPAVPGPVPAAPRASEQEDSLPSAMPGLPERDTTPVDAAIDGVTLSNEGDAEEGMLGSPKTRFAPTDSVYAEIKSNGTAGEYTIYAKWVDAEGNVLADYGVKIDEAGPKRTIISLSKPDGWAVGQNRIELAINGAAQRTVTFEVQ